MAKSKINPEASDIDVTAQLAANAASHDEVGNYDGSNYDAGTYDDVGRDTETPVLGLINGIGGLAKKFKNQAGNFVIGDTVIGPEVTVIPVALNKFFAERFRKGVEIKPGSPEAATRKTFATATEAARAGYVVDFTNRAPNRVEEAGRIGYLVLAPAGDQSGEFVLNAPGLLTRVSIAKCAYQRGSFRKTWRPIFDAAYKRAQALGINTKGMTHSEVFKVAQGWNRLWTLKAAEEEGHGNSWYEPRAIRGVELTPETFNWVSENYGNVKA